MAAYPSRPARLRLFRKIWNIASVVFACLAVPAQAQEPAIVPLARVIGRHLSDGQLAAVHEKLSPATQQALPLPQFERVWKTVIGQFGELQGVGEPVLAGPPESAMALLPLRFKNGSLDLKIAAPHGAIEVFLLVPHVDGAAPAWVAPDYVFAASFRELDVEVGRTALRLPATLALPAGSGPFPAVVLVHGSGPNDRDESIGANKPFKDLAHGLASRGVAVLRYDKRTRVHPEAFKSGAYTIHDEVLEDAAWAIEQLAARPDIAADRIYILGHSLGGTVAPRIAELSPQVAGLIIAAGATRPIPLLMQEQMEYLAKAGSNSGGPAELNERLVSDIKKALAAQPGPDSTPLLGATASYWGDLNAYDAAKAAARFTKRILIIQGGRDYQVTLKDLERYRSALSGRPDAVIKVYPDLNHLLMPGKGPSLPAEYSVPSHVAKEVIEDIADFIKATSAALFSSIGELRYEGTTPPYSARDIAGSAAASTAMQLRCFLSCCEGSPGIVFR